MRSLHHLLLALLLTFAAPALAKDCNHTALGGDCSGTGSPFVATLLNAQTTTATGPAFANLPGTPHTFTCTTTGTGAVSSTIEIEASSDGSNYVTGASGICTISPSGTTTASDGCAVPAAHWAYVRARQTAISGTGATTTCSIGG